MVQGRLFFLLIFITIALYVPFFAQARTVEQLDYNFQSPFLATTTMSVYFPSGGWDDGHYLVTYKVFTTSSASTIGDYVDGVEIFYNIVAGISVSSSCSGIDRQAVSFFENIATFEIDCGQLSNVNPALGFAVELEAPANNPNQTNTYWLGTQSTSSDYRFCNPPTGLFATCDQLPGFGSPWFRLTGSSTFSGSGSPTSTNFLFLKPKNLQYLNDFTDWEFSVSVPTSTVSQYYDVNIRYGTSSLSRTDGTFQVLLPDYNGVKFAYQKQTSLPTGTWQAIADIYDQSQNLVFSSNPIQFRIRTATATVEVYDGLFDEYFRHKFPFVYFFDLRDIYRNSIATTTTNWPSVSLNFSTSSGLNLGTVPFFSSTSMEQYVPHSTIEFFRNGIRFAFWLAFAVFIFQSMRGIFSTKE